MNGLRVSVYDYICSNLILSWFAIVVMIFFFVIPIIIVHQYIIIYSIFSIATVHYFLLFVHESLYFML